MIDATPPALWAAERLWGPGRSAPEHCADLLNAIFGDMAVAGPALLYGAGFGAPAIDLLARGADAVDAYEADAAIARIGARRLADAGGAARIRLRSADHLDAARPQDRCGTVAALRWTGPPGDWAAIAAAAARPGALAAVFALMDGASGARTADAWAHAFAAAGFVDIATADLTARYRAAIMDGLARRVAAIGAADAGRGGPEALAAASEIWLRRAGALDAGRLTAQTLRARRRD